MAKSRLSTCRDCGEYIVWTITAAGRKMPIDADSVNGDDEFYCAASGHVSHFDTCRARKPKSTPQTALGILRYFCPKCALELEVEELLEIPAFCTNCPPGARGILQGPFAPKKGPGSGNG